MNAHDYVFGERIAEPDPRPDEFARSLLRGREVARLLQVSLPHLRRLEKDGRIPRAIRLGRCLRWRRAEIDAWIAQGCPQITSNGQEESNDGQV